MVLCFHIKNAWFYHLSQAQLPVKIQYTMKKSYISCDIANAISIWILGAPSCEEVFNKLTIYNGAHKIYGKFQLRPPCAKLAHLKQPPFVYKGLTQKKYGLIQHFPKYTQHPLKILCYLLGFQAIKRLRVHLRSNPLRDLMFI